jgi:uncharacterized membrane protein YphA (DoxX/SURF4 family)
MLSNNLFFQNRAFRITAPTPPAVGPVQLVPSLSQTVTGSCPAGATYWDIGVYNDTSPTPNSGSGLALNPQYSMLTSTTGYAGTNIAPASAGVVKQFCNGSRVPPEIAPQLCTGPNGFANAQGCIQPGTVGIGITVPSGVPDSTPPPLAQFTLTPAATVDEGSNWINMFYGPLSLVNPTILSGGAGYGVTIGNYAPAAGSPAIGAIPTSSPTFAVTPRTDYFGNPRPAVTNGTVFSIGAVEIAGGSATLVGIAPSTGAFGSWVIHNPSTAEQFTYTNTGSATVTVTTVVLSDTTDYSLSFNGCAGHVLNAGLSCTVAIQFTPSTTGVHNGTLTVNGGAPASISLTGTGIAPSATLVGTLPQPFPANFGSVVEGQAQTVQQIYTYTNTSAASTGGVFTITGTTLTEGTPPVNAADFSVAFGNCTNGKVLTPGNSCTIQMQFNPHSTGAINATLTVTGPSAQSVTLTGTGLYAPSAVTVSTPNPALTTTTANLTTKRGVVTVTNTGPGKVSLTAVPTITRATGTGTFSAYTPATGTRCTATTVLASGAACVVGVQYVPTDTATSTAHVSVTDTGTGATQTTVATQSSANFTGN